MVANDWVGFDEVDFIGVRFDGSARREGQSYAPVALREAGLVAAFGDGARLLPDVTTSTPVPERGNVAGFYNERALLEMLDLLYERVRSSLVSDRFPFVYGADCSVLLAAVPAAASVQGTSGLLFVDAHEDATPMEVSTTGEAANMEIALLLGLGENRTPEPLHGRLPALRYTTIAMLGQRDQAYRNEIPVASIADRVWFRSPEEVSREPGGAGREAVKCVSSEAPRWWLHIDVDVLNKEEFDACGAARDPAMKGGLTWKELEILTLSALKTGGCRGWSLGVYNPDLDPDRRMAGRIVDFLGKVAAGCQG